MRLQQNTTKQDFTRSRVTCRRPAITRAQSQQPNGSAAATKTSLYEKLGGHDAVIAAVDKFYDKVLADERVNSYFQGTDMRKQRAHQAAFMTMAFGGPSAYNGKDMASAHRNLMPHLNEGHFGAIVENFVATLTEMGVAQEDIDAAVAVVASTKKDVLAD